MPYIPQEKRDILDKQIDELLEKIEEVHGDNEGDFAGLLNYAVTSIILRWLDHRGISYFRIALITGALKNVSDEFYRRHAVPYEDIKIKENGDV